MQGEDDLKGLAKIMAFMRTVSIIMISLITDFGSVRRIREVKEKQHTA
ncbi:hypothetical protein [Chryseobacterium sp. MMS23-Vi53]